MVTRLISLSAAFIFATYLLNMKYILILLVFPIVTFGQSKNGTTATSELPRPKLVVGLVVDQMRWDYLYRFYDRYGNDGFKRLLKEGFSCENAQIPYAQTVTAAGHASIYTGSVPAINGIMANEWYSRAKGKDVYCVDDDRVTTIGGAKNAEPMSPRNLLTTTIGDELMLATNYRSKVVGVAIKDRGSILPAGHFGKAYWYDAVSGNWVTSTYYQKELPQWVQQFNARKVTDSLYASNWPTLYPIDTYVLSDKDNVAYEGKFLHEKAPVFPHELASQMGVNPGTIRTTPQGNTLTLAFAKSALAAEGLGKDNITDLLAISLSSTDYIGHQFGLNSIEMEDTYLRLDAELAAFFKYLDEKVGKGAWTFFLSADHGVAHVPGFLQKSGYQVATVGNSTSQLNKAINHKFGIEKAIVASSNYHIYLDHHAIDSVKADKEAIIHFTIDALMKDTAVLLAFEMSELNEMPMPAVMKDRFINGANAQFSGDIVVVLKSGFFAGGRTGTTHGAWYPYDAHIPMAFLGWGIRSGATVKPTYMTDIAPTIAALLHIQAPSGCVGQPVQEVLK